MKLSVKSTTALLICLLGQIAYAETVLQNFVSENIERCRTDSAKISQDSKTLKIDTLDANVKSYRDILQFKRGLLKPDTSYILTMRTKVDAGDPDSYLHFLVRNTKNFVDGSDILHRNEAPSREVSKIKIKFRTNNDGGDYAILVSSRKRIRAEISDLKIETDDSVKFIPIFENREELDISKLKIPAGAKNFTVDKPENPKGEVVEAKRFGIVPQENVSLKKLGDALAYCKKNGAAKLLFEKNAVYNFRENGGFVIDGFYNFTLDGNGATFVWQKKGLPNFVVKNCKRIKLQNFKVDWDWKTDPLASIVEVANIDRKNRFVDYVFTGYEKHPKFGQYLRAATLSGWDDTENSVGIEGVGAFAYDMFSGRDTRPKTEWIAPNAVRIYGSQCDLALLKIGRRFRMQHYYYDIHNMVMLSNEHLTLSDISVLSNAGHAFLMSDGKYTFFRRVKIVAPDDPLRVITCTADHFHVACSRGFIKLVNCEFSGGADDCINFHDNTAFGVKISEKSLATRNPYGGTGAEIEFRNPDYSPVNFSARVLKSERLPDGKCAVFIDKNLPEGKAFVMFDKTFDTRNIIVKNCRFHHNRARGILVLARDVTIENCRFKRNEMGAIKIETGYTNTSWCEGYGVDNVLVKNCSFDACNQVGVKSFGMERDISISTYLKSDPSFEQAKYPILQNIAFVGNSFKNAYGLVASIASAKNVVFAHNRISNDVPRLTPRRYRGGFFVAQSQNIAITQNIYKKSPLSPKIGVWFDSETVEKISVHENTEE